MKKPFKKKAVVKKAAPIKREGPIHDQFAKALGAISHQDIVEDVKHFLPSGSFLLDCLLSDGRGWPLGRIVEIVGRTHSGKTSLSCLAGASAQRHGGTFIYLATEPGILSSKTWLKKLGVEPDYMLAFKPNSIEECLKHLHAAAEIGVHSPSPTVIAWGSVAASTTLKKLEGGKEGIAEAARIIADAFRGPFLRDIAQTKILLLLENQLKTGFGPMGTPVDTSYGGSAIGFYSTVQLKLGQREYREGDLVIGNLCHIEVKKNNVIGGGRSASILWRHSAGMDESGSIAYHLREHKALPTNGSWLTLGPYVCHGWTGLEDKINEDPEAMRLARQAVYATFHPGSSDKCPALQ